MISRHNPKYFLTKLKRIIIRLEYMEDDMETKFSRKNFDTEGLFIRHAVKMLKACASRLNERCNKPQEE